MSRRVSLPAADDLFRPTGGRSAAPGADPTEAPSRGLQAVEDGGDVAPDASASGAGGPAAEPASRTRKASGRIRHDEKMTVYVTSDELLDIEHARLTLRRTTGKAVDRGRLVRSAIAIALADLEQNGDDSVLVARLRES